MTIAEILRDNDDRLTDSDLANLAAWASRQIPALPRPRRKAFGLIREGFDLALRERQMEKEG